MKLRHAVDNGPMSAFQWQAIAICFLLNAIDGLDVLAMAFTASAVSHEWGLSGAELGMLLSAGIVGMAIGSALIAPFADTYGRRPLIMLSLLLSGTCMTLSFWSPNPQSLAVLRVLTGIGVGTILASANVLSSEYANRRWRGLAISLQSVGFALGATLGGLLATYLNDTLGWRYVFLTGGLLTLLALLVVAVQLPESLDFLLHKRPAQALARVNTLASKLKQPSLAQLPEQSAEVSRHSNYRQLFDSRNLTTTLLLGMAFFLVMFSFYFVMSWTPRLLEAAGLSAEHGIAGGMLLNLGGMVGALLMGVGASRIRLSAILHAFLLLTAIMLVVMVPAAQFLALALSVGFFIGLLLNGAIAGLYTTVPQSYDAAIRASGVGVVLGFGRLGAIVSPLVAGVLLDAAWQPARLYALYAGALLLALGVMLMFHAHVRPRLSRENTV
ncbi:MULTISPECIES: MFS transporter [Halomonadaceae]|uniref:MFS transporter n=1 Tax=Halomonadaceae TaxID=28256 RepID=UPI001C27EFF4|nr:MULTISPECIES: MFS transporter [Halomonas]